MIDFFTHIWYAKSQLSVESRNLRIRIMMLIHTDLGGYGRLQILSYFKMARGKPGQKRLEKT